MRRAACRGGVRPRRLGRILIRVTTETHRHAGHADIVRELIDGTAGFRDGATNLPDEDAAWWIAHRDRLERVARRVCDQVEARSRRRTGCWPQASSRAERPYFGRSTAAWTVLVLGNVTALVRGVPSGGST
jgi:hypothetical protein